MKHFGVIVGLSFGLATSAVAQEPVWDGNTVVLEAQMLADGVYAVIPVGAQELADQGLPVATSGGFVVGKDAVLVVESMLNARLNGQLFDLIDRGHGCAGEIPGEHQLSRRSFLWEFLSA